MTTWAEDNVVCKFCARRYKKDDCSESYLWLGKQDGSWVCPWCREKQLDVIERQREFDEKYVTCDKCQGKGYVQR